MKPMTGKTKLILNHDLVRIVEQDGALTLYIRTKSGQWLVQNPYQNDLRGMIGAMTLALDALAGKIMPVDIVNLDESSFDPKRLAALDGKVEKIDVKKLGN